MLVYLVASALHGACDIDVTNPVSQGTVMTSAVSDVGHGAADKAMVANHHCHGCFSVSVAIAMSASAPAAFAGQILEVAQPDLVGTAPMLDTPPPKHLT